ncbi:adenosylcobinamide-GDP ribazoletransferase [Prochlorothrix hollandica]|uniref:Adenosylcobinamide-GDP ribazoletransferase n=1 Tax=Prochlorothrix hollandica PCC 9006 = CALU 1027 TaxID=317619 RepID=A0A0M2PWL4_PROHO|nr:adenosylcobinamide-GDP ribazoletransferase [Prochlorothrix hollandica]KKJ00575.1 cobalamin synthase [Prochlorothrix hollandica PCC 9006 = CALU 1027]
MNGSPPSPLSSFLASLTFYTTIPLAWVGPLTFHRIARFAPWVGLLLGCSLGLLDQGLAAVGMPPLTRAALGVAIWVGLTGGLHLDGAMDSADGLAVMAPDRRLEVMADSVTGAFGAMVAVLILLLKTLAWVELPRGLPGESLWLLALVAGWGRWAQVVAIARYPYLKAQGKGAFHKKEFETPWDWLLGLVSLIVIASLGFLCHGLSLVLVISLTLGGVVLGLGIPAWFNQQLGGHTGDTYGAVVEWTEALLLCGLTVFSAPGT